MYHSHVSHTRTLAWREWVSSSVEDSNVERNLGVLHYFHALGRGEQIRLLLQKFNKNFEDRRISFDDWSELKPRFPGQQLPCWEENGLYMNESTAVLRYLGKKFGCYPLNNLSMACRVDEVVEFLDGFITFFMMTSEQKDMSQETQALWRENV